MNKTVEEWMGKLSVSSCRVYVIDRQLKEQFIHGLNENEMLAEIIKELTKAEEDILLTGEQILVWAKSVEAQKEPK